MAQKLKSKMVYYHSQSENIFRERMPQIAILVNSMKPHLQRLGFLNGDKFTKIAKNILENKYSLIDDMITDQVKKNGGNIEYVENQIRKDLEEKKRQLVSLVDVINSKIESQRDMGLQRPSGRTIDYNQCLSQNFLSIDEINDVFLVDEQSVINVKSRFEIHLEGDGLRLFEELCSVADILNSIIERVKKMGVDTFYFSPLDLLISDMNQKDFKVDSLEIYSLLVKYGELVPVWEQEN
ncbi:MULTISPECIES: hypothetical protein [Sphingobacterium]|uniref:Uncharacterized protein n=1 Tax=Sphingobacterium tenebrionis TaxID=3111775 RepID=A0ABU8I5H7_9SPHI|nr:hypothetical protein [Sphingobacterium sp. CZ-2]QBR11475.1 hypothetical protein E3D81_04515 [Sphingobacterium sp. CZ-2]